ncbi:MAG TPA: hypothetical protein VKR42_03860, partial [Ktedonobacteraceae bacterium]|nr:hypothetical protein [Ktedonobacteraceae bacterium]
MATPNNSQIPTVGVLLIHGLNGNRRDMQELADYLGSHDMIAENMLLPGHGLPVRELMPLDWTDWAEAVDSELRTLKQRCDVVFLV